MGNKFKVHIKTSHVGIILNAGRSKKIPEMGQNLFRNCWCYVEINKKTNYLRVDFNQINIKK